MSIRRNLRTDYRDAILAIFTGLAVFAILTIGAILAVTAIFSRLTIFTCDALLTLIAFLKLTLLKSYQAFIVCFERTTKKH